MYHSDNIQCEYDTLFHQGRSNLLDTEVWAEVGLLPSAAVATLPVCQYAPGWICLKGFKSDWGGLVLEPRIPSLSQRDAELQLSRQRVRFAKGSTMSMSAAACKRSTASSTESAPFFNFNVHYIASYHPASSRTNLIFLIFRLHSRPITYL